MSLLHKFNTNDNQGYKYTCEPTGLLKVFTPRARGRIIGKIIMNSKGKLSYEKRVKEKQLFKPNGTTPAWGINYFVLSNLDGNGDIILHCDNQKVYKINVDKARDVGKFLYFKRQGYEKQLFISLNDWEVS